MRFLRKDDFLSVMVSIRLVNWNVWPIPIVLDISEDEKKELENLNSNEILLKNNNWENLAILINIVIFLYYFLNFTIYHLCHSFIILFHYIQSFFSCII
jgi:ATP sulfurylase